MLILFLACPIISDMMSIKLFSVDSFILSHRIPRLCFIDSALKTKSIGRYYNRKTYKVNAAQNFSFCFLLNCAFTPCTLPSE